MGHEYLFHYKQVFVTTDAIITEFIKSEFVITEFVITEFITTAFHCNFKFWLVILTGFAKLPNDGSTRNQQVEKRIRNVSPILGLFNSDKVTISFFSVIKKKLQPVQCQSVQINNYNGYHHLMQSFGYCDHKCLATTW